MSSLSELTTQILAFRDARNWKQFHNPKDLAISLSLEASELLENFQWKSSEEALDKKRLEITDEVADVAMYLLLLCDAIGIDLETSILNKLAQNAKKYPVEKAFGRSEKYTEL